MKTIRILLLSVLGFTGAGVLRAFDLTQGFAHTEVVFLEPKNFTDVKDSLMATDAGRDATLADIKEYIVKGARRYLAPGQKLSVTITDVDLAGEYEPWHGPRFDEVRIVRDLYPPRINLAFRLTNADGEVVKEGERKLADLSFMMRLVFDRNDPLRYEKNLLDDWLSEAFRPVKST